MKKLFLLPLVIFTSVLLCGCSKDEEKNIVGEWSLTRIVSTETALDGSWEYHSDEVVTTGSSLDGYIFRADGTGIDISEAGYITNFTYVVDGNILRTKSIPWEYIHKYIIEKLTAEELILYYTKYDRDYILEEHYYYQKI